MLPSSMMVGLCSMLKHRKHLLQISDPIFLILYRELYYRHVYSRLQPNIDDRFHSYENSCELFNYLLSPYRSLPPSSWSHLPFQIPRAQFNSNCLNNGSGTSLTNLYTNIKSSAPGAQKSSQKQMTNSRCWQRVAQLVPFL